MSPEVRRRRRTRTWRRLRRSAAARPRLAIAAGIGVVALLGVAWCVWRAMSVAGDLEDVDHSARVMKAALERGDVDGARTALADYRDAAAEAESGTAGPTWSLLRRLPVYGDDASAVATVAEVLADLGEDGLPPLVEAGSDVTAHAFHPKDGTFPLDRIAGLAEPAARSEKAFTAADRRLADVDAGNLSGPVADRFVELRGLVRQSRTTLGSAYRAARLMPAWLGADGPRDYLLVLQNNAELRSTGGLPGSVSVVHAEDGRVEITDQRDMADLGRTDRPVLPLTAEERQVFGPVLGTIGVDATLTPDVDRAAALIRARWQQVTGRQIDGVFLIDPVAVSYLLAGTGPVPVPGYAEVSAGNVVQAVENQIYLRSDDRAQHSAFQNAVAESVFDAFAGGQGDPVTVIRGLAAAVTEGRLRVHSFVPAEQRQIAGTAIAGEFPTAPTERPGVGLYLNDALQAKMNYYLDYRATLVARSCAADVQVMAGSIEITNNVPDRPGALPDAVTGGDQATAPPGDQRIVVYLMSPVSGSIRALDQGAGERRPAVQRFHGREVATIGVHLEPGETRRIEFVVRGGGGQTGDIDFAVTPGARPGNAPATVRSAC